MASFGRIFSQQQNLVTKVSLFMANYGRELKMGADIRKKKNKEGDRVFGKNKESTGGSWDGVKKKTREDKATGRQEKERS